MLRGEVLRLLAKGSQAGGADCGTSAFVCSCRLSTFKEDIVVKTSLNVPSLRHSVAFDREICNVFSLPTPSSASVTSSLSSHATSDSSASSDHNFCSPPLRLSHPALVNYMGFCRNIHIEPRNSEWVENLHALSNYVTKEVAKKCVANSACAFGSSSPRSLSLAAVFMEELPCDLLHLACARPKHLMSKYLQECLVRSWLLNDLLPLLQYFEQMQFVHCDIKPDNVFVLANGHIKLGDLGDGQFTYSPAPLRGTSTYHPPAGLSPAQCSATYRQHLPYASCSRCSVAPTHFVDLYSVCATMWCYLTVLSPQNLKKNDWPHYLSGFSADLIDFFFMVFTKQRLPGHSPAKCMSQSTLVFRTADDPLTIKDLLSHPFLSSGRTLNDEDLSALFSYLAPPAPASASPSDVVPGAQFRLFLAPPSSAPAAPSPVGHISVHSSATCNPVAPAYPVFPYTAASAVSLSPSMSVDPLMGLPAPCPKISVSSASPRTAITPPPATLPVSVLFPFPVTNRPGCSVESPSAAFHPGSPSVGQSQRTISPPSQVHPRLPLPSVALAATVTLSNCSSEATSPRPPLPPLPPASSSSAFAYSAPFSFGASSSVTSSTRSAAVPVFSSSSYSVPSASFVPTRSTLWSKRPASSITVSPPAKPTVAHATALTELSASVSPTNCGSLYFIPPPAKRQRHLPA